MYSKSKLNNIFFIPVCCIVVLLLASGMDRPVAAEKYACSAEVTGISTVDFEPLSLAFRDARQGRYVGGNIVIAGNEYFSATIRKQIVEGVASTLNVYSGFADLSVGYIAVNPDRYGRKKVYLFGEANQRWMQLDLVEAGLALVNPEDGEPKCIEQLFEAENIARKNQVGDWQIPELIMHSNDADWQKRVQSFQLVEGTLLSVGKTSSRYYLNFGNNWSEDFTVIVAKRNIKRFKMKYEDLKRLAGKKIRVRGWLIQDRGPMIEVFHPGQIEIDIQ